MTPLRDSAPVVVIGAGVGGLAVAIRLAAAGLPVTVLERAARPGGKLREVTVGGLAIDAGPTVLTLPWVFDELFAAAGRERSAWVRFTPIEPACRHFFADGAVLDLYNDEGTGSGPELGAWRAGTDEPWARSAAEVARVLGPRAAEQFRRYRRHAAGLYAAVRRPFLLRPLPSNPLLIPLRNDPRDALGLLRLDLRHTLWQSLERFFDDPHLRVLFARYATYCGSDPFLAPATLNVIPHVEFGFGVHRVEGGMYRLAEALCALARELGVPVRYGADVRGVVLDGPRVVAVELDGERVPARAVVANCDVSQLYARLLQPPRLPRLQRQARKVSALAPSLSAHLLLGVARDTAGLPLVHHNVFFSADYAGEFAQLRAGRDPGDATVYLCAPDPGDGADRWFFLVNAPPLPADGVPVDAPVYGRIAAQLRRHRIDLEHHLGAHHEVRPAGFAALFPESRGALYGPAGNSALGAFLRPRNRVPGVSGLYCVGGSTHPGAGLPMVALSARITADLLRQDFGQP